MNPKNVFHVNANLDAVQNVAVASAIIISVCQNVIVERAAQTSQWTDKLSERQAQHHLVFSYGVLADLHLDQEDKHAILHDRWLSDKHIYAAQILQYLHILVAYNHRRFHRQANGKLCHLN